MAGTGETAGSDSEEEEEFGLERVIFSPDAVCVSVDANS